MKSSDMNQESAPVPRTPLAFFDPTTQALRMNPAYVVQVAKSAWRGEVPLYVAPAPVAHHDDGMPTSDDERALRRLLAARVAMPGTYMDDGEAQGQQHGITIDFMREPAADIDAKLRALSVARVERAAPVPVAPVLTPAQQHADDLLTVARLAAGCLPMGSAVKAAVIEVIANVESSAPAPVAQHPLTEEQINALWWQVEGVLDRQPTKEWWKQFARAIERAHGIAKEGGVA